MERFMITDEQGAFRALADPTRRRILKHLSKNDLTIAEVADKFSITRGAIKKHLGILEEGQLITVTPQGRERINKLHPEGLKAAAEWMSYFSHFWDDKLASLQNAIEENTDKDEKHDK